jgi:hypothetical protein
MENSCVSISFHYWVDSNQNYISPTVFSIDKASPIQCNGGLISRNKKNGQTQINPPLYVLFICFLQRADDKLKIYPSVECTIDVVKILDKICHVCSEVHYENWKIILKYHFINLRIMFICLCLE